jgi:integral membrane sensor domain MASE1
MQLPAARPQTSVRTLGYVVFVMFVFAAGTSIVDPHPGDPYWVPQWLLTGLWFATLYVASAYRRLPLDQRLAPLSAAALGIVNLGFTAWMVQHARQPPIPVRPVEWLLLSVMAMPSVYLLVAGLRQYRGGRGASRLREGGA